MTEIQNKPYLMAILSGLAYGEPSEVSKKFRKHGFNNYKYCSKQGAQCYIVWNDTDAVICFRGTEPKEVSDIKADLNAVQKQGLHNKGDVHAGFQGEINKIWDAILEKVNELDGQTIYITGHSLGGAMATICAKRLQEQKVEVQCLYTYGSPRVGDRKWVKSLQIPHYRFQNNNDVVCKVPFWIMGYRHHGKSVYISYSGKICKMNMWRRFIDGMRGRLKAWSKRQLFDGIYDHNITSYTKRVKGYDV